MAYQALATGPVYFLDSNSKLPNASTGLNLGNNRSNQNLDKALLGQLSAQGLLTPGILVTPTLLRTLSALQLQRQMILPGFTSRAGFPFRSSSLSTMRLLICHRLSAIQALTFKSCRPALTPLHPLRPRSHRSLDIRIRGRLRRLTQPCKSSASATMRRTLAAFIPAV
jgi:hypothetical protein